ncbi:MAG: universal stress protein [Deltaproteobacteria bacterium]|nr:universal stress protein [Deltaproteobacteria bacterium]
MQNIIVPIDFSPISEVVLDIAKILAQCFSARLWLIHVASPDPDFVGYDAGPQSVRDQLAEHLREEHQRLQATAAELREAGIETTALLIQGATADKILAEADHHAADLIVMGSHGHGAMHRALMGSVSERVLRKAACPVTIIPHQVAKTA